MLKRRRLGDLYVRGRELTIDDGLGEPVTVWLQKLNSVDRASCVRRAQAQRARFMVDADDHDSDLYQSTYAQARSLGDRKTLVDFITAEDLAQTRQRVESELAHDEEAWGKDNYIQGLLDLWVGDEANPGLAARRTEEPDDPEVKRVGDELDKFDKEVTERAKADMDKLIADWSDASDEDVWQQACKCFLETRAVQMFGDEFERQQLFYSIRDPDDHKKRYLATVAELDDLDDDVREQVRDAYNALMVDPTEGKGSRASRSSSNSSDPSPAVEVQSGSGLQVASA